MQRINNESELLFRENTQRELEILKLQNYRGYADKTDGDSMTQYQTSDGLVRHSYDEKGVLVKWELIKER